MAGRGPFVQLIAKHYLDTQECDKALELCEGRETDVLGAREIAEAARRVKEALAAERKRIETAADNPQVRIVTQKGAIDIELFEDDAPRSVRNFMSLVLKDKFYDNLAFHSVSGGSSAHAGDPRTRPGSKAESDGPGFELKADKPKRPLLRGYVAVLPLPEDKGFHGSQFVIAVSPLMPRDAVVFGRVTAGMDIVDHLEQGDRIERIEVVAKRKHDYDPTDSRG
jgi:peptidyl-prolyl cis-trans isomerase B (cyclophilin B)